MSKHARNENDMMGYLLPEDSQFRLKKLHAHMVFLSQLAQPRTHDEDTTGWGPQISGDDLAVCLELLAEQAEQVLDDMTWTADAGRERSGARDGAGDRLCDEAGDEGNASDVSDASDVPMAVGASANGMPQDEASDASDDAAPDMAGAGATAPHATAVDHDVGEAGEVGAVGVAGEPGHADIASAADGSEEPAAAETLKASAAPGFRESPWVFGMTMAQLDKLNLLHDRLRAQGDLVFSVERVDLADGTLTNLGDLIVETAGAGRDLMDQVATQMLPRPDGWPTRVREARAAYGATTRLGVESGTAMPVFLPASGVDRPPETATRH